jgi:PIN domain nuclease of toxin-antitoxin system
MNLLLDTHVVLWALADPERLGELTRAAIVDRNNAVAVSAASVWEVEIKRAIGKLDAPDGFASRCTEAGYDEVPISFEHATRAGRLPPHHGDPFDRMLIGQALVEGFEIVTADAAFRPYGARVRSPFD